MFRSPRGGQFRRSGVQHGVPVQLPLISGGLGFISALNKNPDPHQKIHKLDPEPFRIRINLQMSSQNVWNMSLF
jgi:hypothetical protein